MTSCLHCQDTRVMEYAVDSLCMNSILSIVDLLSACFPAKKFEIQHLNNFNGVVMLEGSSTQTSIFGFQFTAWEPLAVMTVKREPPGAEGFGLAHQAVNITNVCVRQDLRGQGVGSKMLKWYLNSLHPGMIAFLHVDKKPEASAESSTNSSWRDMVLKPVTYLENGQEKTTPEQPASSNLSASKQTEPKTLVDWYKSLGFHVHYTNEVETCLCHYAHMEVANYDSDDWRSDSSNDADSEAET